MHMHIFLAFPRSSIWRDSILSSLRGAVRIRLFDAVSPGLSAADMSVGFDLFNRLSNDGFAVTLNSTNPGVRDRGDGIASVCCTNNSQCDSAWATLHTTSMSARADGQDYLAGPLQRAAQFELLKSQYTPAHDVIYNSLSMWGKPPPR
jgi:hypothetical protein